MREFMLDLGVVLALAAFLIAIYDYGGSYGIHTRRTPRDGKKRKESVRAFGPQYRRFIFFRLGIVPRVRDGSMMEFWDINNEAERLADKRLAFWRGFTTGALFLSVMVWAGVVIFILATCL